MNQEYLELHLDHNMDMMLLHLVDMIELKDHHMIECPSLKDHPKGEAILIDNLKESKIGRLKDHKKELTDPLTEHLLIDHQSLIMIDSLLREYYLKVMEDKREVPMRDHLKDSQVMRDLLQLIDNLKDNLLHLLHLLLRLITKDLKLDLMGLKDNHLLKDIQDHLQEDLKGEDSIGHQEWKDQDLKERDQDSTDLLMKDLLLILKDLDSKDLDLKDLDLRDLLKLDLRDHLQGMKEEDTKDLLQVMRDHHLDMREMKGPTQHIHKFPN